MGVMFAQHIAFYQNKHLHSTDGPVGLIVNAKTEGDVACEPVPQQLMVFRLGGVKRGEERYPINVYQGEIAGNPPPWHAFDSRIYVKDK